MAPGSGVAVDALEFSRIDGTPSVRHPAGRSNPVGRLRGRWSQPLFRRKSGRPRPKPRGLREDNRSGQVGRVTRPTSRPRGGGCEGSRGSPRGRSAADWRTGEAAIEHGRQRVRTSADRMTPAGWSPRREQSRRGLLTLHASDDHSGRRGTGVVARGVPHVAPSSAAPAGAPPRCAPRAASQSFHRRPRPRPGAEDRTT